MIHLSRIAAFIYIFIPASCTCQVIRFVDGREATNASNGNSPLDGQVADTNKIFVRTIVPTTGGSYEEYIRLRDLTGASYDLRSIRRKADAGTASALAAAGLPQPYQAGKGMIAVAAGTFGGQSALAFGLSKALNDNHTVVKAAATYDTRGSGGGSAGVGWQF